MLKFRIKFEKSVDFINIFVKLWYWLVKSPVLELFFKIYFYSKNF